MSNIQKISDVEHPQIGRYYLVPCVDWIPVIGPWHEDAEDIGFHRWHYHRDVRFFTVDEMRPCSSLSLALALVVAPDSPPVVYRRRRMLREMPEFPLLSESGRKIDWLKRLEKRFSNVKMKCRLCPHRGMPLDQMKPDAEGNIVCHGHGLKWNVSTGQMIPR